MIHSNVGYFLLPTICIVLLVRTNDLKHKNFNMGSFVMEILIHRCWIPEFVLR